MSKFIIAGLSVAILGVLAYTIKRKTKSKPKATMATRTIDDLYFSEQDLKPAKKQKPKKIEAKLRDYSIYKDYAPIVLTFLFAIIVSGLVLFLSQQSHQAFTEREQKQALQTEAAYKTQSEKQAERDSTYKANTDSTLHQLERIIANQNMMKK